MIGKRSTWTGVKAVAEEAGVSISHVARCLKGERIPGPKLAEALRRHGAKLPRRKEPK